MRYFLEHMPKDDHDDVFASSPMQNKQIKVVSLIQGHFINDTGLIKSEYAFLFRLFVSCLCFLQMEMRKISASFRILRRRVLAWL